MLFLIRIFRETASVIFKEIILERKEKKVEYMGSCNANFVDAVLLDFENLNSANKLSGEEEFRIMLLAFSA